MTPTKGRNMLPDPTSPALSPIPANPCEACCTVEEAHHRVANHLGMIASFVRMSAKALDDRGPEIPVETVRLLLQKIVLQLDATARLHRLLSVEWQIGSMDIAEHLRTVFTPLVSLLSGSIDLVEDLAPGCRVGADQVLPLTQICAEVVTNAAKHAYAAGAPGEIRINCRKIPTGSAMIEIINDGHGLPAGLDPYTAGGLGFRLVRALAKQLKAGIEFESRVSGLTFRLTLPAPDPSAG